MTKHSGLMLGAIAMVTGATSGIGAALTKVLLARGCKVIGSGRNVARMEAMTARLGEAFHPLVLDITDPEATAALPDSLP
jgi:NADP-dependent 3-hydroxy acid dehydrogenase YdfG